MVESGSYNVMRLSRAARPCIDGLLGVCPEFRADSRTRQRDEILEPNRMVKLRCAFERGLERHPIL